MRTNRAYNNPPARKRKKAVNSRPPRKRVHRALPLVDFKCLAAGDR